MVYSRAWGKVIHEKNLNKKISRHCPFKKISSQSNDDFSCYSDTILLPNGRCIWVTGYRILAIVCTI